MAYNRQETDARIIIDRLLREAGWGKLGMAQVVVYQHKKPFIYQDQLLQLQEEAKKKKLGLWSL